MLANNVFKNNQVLSYFILTFIISWGAILCIIGPNDLPAASEEAKQAIGLGLLLGPSMAAFILTAVLEGRVRFRDLLLPRSININLSQIKVGGSSYYYVIALLIAPLSSVVTLIMLSTFVSEAYTPKLFTSTNKPPLVLTGIGVGLIIATFEEIGWSGYVVPRLLQTHSEFYTGVITGVIWGLWHFPPFWEVDTFSSQIPLLLLFGRLFTWIIVYRVIMVWIYSRMKRSVALMMMILMHTSLVFCMIAIEPLLQGSDLLMYILSWTVALWLVVWLGASCCKSECTHDKGQ
eukprot:scaffold6868_cov120-Skeletonema_marinoi.AAC.13